MHGRASVWAATLVLGSCLIWMSPAANGEVGAPGEAGQAEDAASEAPAPDRPKACLDGTLGAVRVQIGTVEALGRVGQELPLPVRVKGVCDLAAFTLGIHLDQHVAELVRVEQTPFLQGDPPVDLEFSGIDPATGTHKIQVSRPAGTGGVDGIGTLVRLIIRGRTAGSTEITVIRPRLLNSAGELIESVVMPVRLTIIDTSMPRRRPRQR